MENDLAVLLAWPETYCKQAGAWYDPLMQMVGVNHAGYYKVGHAAIVMISKESGVCHYFDFGRYHSPNGYGRVRNQETDHELALSSRISFDSNGEPTNLQDVLDELEGKEACHGEGQLHAGLVSINFNSAYSKAKEMQDKEFIPYGPFTLNGSNCSRFVQVCAISGMSFSLNRLGLKYPLMLTPTPKWNATITKRNLNRFVEKAPNYETEIA